MSWYSGFRARLRATLQPGRADAELREEIAHHIDLETANQVADSRIGLMLSGDDVSVHQPGEAWIVPAKVLLSFA